MTAWHDLGKPSWRELKEEWKEEGVYSERVEELRDRFETEFRENQEKDVPTHPYKIFRRIAEREDLDDEDRIVLEHLKEEYADRWVAEKEEETGSRTRPDRSITSSRSGDRQVRLSAISSLKGGNE